MSQGADLNPLNTPSAGEFLGVDPGSANNYFTGKNLYRQKGGPRAPMAPKTRFEILRTQLDLERESWRPHVLDLKNNFQPYRTRWLDDGGDPNRGYKKTQYIVDNCPVLAVRTLAAGLMSSVTNPSRPWLRIKPKRKELMLAPGIPEWCEAVTQGVLKVFAE